MDDALRAPAAWRWITITPLSTAPTFAHNLHSRHHYEYKPLKPKIQGRKPRNGPVRLVQQRWLWGLLAFSRAERRESTGTSHSDVLPMPGEGMVIGDSLGGGAVGIGLIAAQGKSFRDPQWRTRNRCTAWRGSDAMGHAGFRGCDGARISWRRRNVSMMCNTHQHDRDKTPCLAYGEARRSMLASVNTGLNSQVRDERPLPYSGQLFRLGGFHVRRRIARPRGGFRSHVAACRRRRRLIRWCTFCSTGERVSLPTFSRHG